MEPQTLEMPDADVLYYRELFDAEESQRFMQDLAINVHWRQEELRTPGGFVPFPRLVAWYGDAGKSYTYSHISLNPEPWTPTLLTIKARVESVSGAIFNSVLLNYYRNERDSVSWHSDDEPELGPEPVIASLSFGASRLFQFKHKSNPELRTAVEPASGSLLLMRGKTQRYWKHQIPKSKKPLGPRINLTFRVIYR